MWVLLRPHDSQEPLMQTVTTIGLDIAKSVFRVHGVDAAGPIGCWGQKTQGLVARKEPRRTVGAIVKWSNAPGTRGVSWAAGLQRSNSTSRAKCSSPRT